MSNRTSRRRVGVTITDLAAVTAACALAAALLPPTIEHLQETAEPVTCANNLSICAQAWGVYADQFNGVWMAPWDQNPAPGQFNSMYQQWPHTMVFYVTGNPITDGMPVRDASAGWWSTQGRGGPAWEFCSSPDDAPQLQCPTISAMGPMENMLWYGATSYSYAIMQRQNFSTGHWSTNISAYPIPDLMTHASSTVQLHDMAVILSEGGVNAWSTYDSLPLDPHDGKSNYLFADGHVELLAADETEPNMWRDQLRPELIGDADEDGDVDLDDFVILKTNFGAEKVGWSGGDFNLDRKVDLDDFVILKNNFGATAPR